LKPLYEKIIKPTEQYADLVIPRFGGEFNLNSPTNTKDALGFDNISHKILWLLVKIVKANIIGNPSNK
jgi:uridine kinase